MEKNRLWKKQVVTALELAPDLDGGETKISLTGSGEAVIENYKGILQYTDSEILIQSLRGKVSSAWQKYGNCLVYLSGNEDYRVDLQYSFAAEMTTGYGKIIKISIWICDPLHRGRAIGTIS